MSKFTLGKKEILSSKKEISALFEQGRSLYKYPLKLFYGFVDKKKDDGDFPPVLFSVSVPKKFIRKAVERNLIKRRIREAYRQNKYDLYSKIPDGKQLKIMYVYIGRKPEKYFVIKKALMYLTRALNFNDETTQ